jgi:hypothetical protein
MDDCFDDADSGDELRLESVSLAGDALAEKWAGEEASAQSPAGVQEAATLAHEPLASDVCRPAQRSSSRSVKTGSSRSVAKSASKRMGKEAAASVLATTVRNLRGPCVGAALLEKSAQTLRDLTSGQGLEIDDVVETGALDCVLDAAAQHVNHPGATEEACRFSADACEKSGAARALVARRQAAAYFCRVIRLHNATYVSVAESAVRALGAACACGHVLHVRGGVELILAAMRRWKETRSMQSVALRAVEQTCSEGNVQNRAELAEYGGIQEVTSCMFFFGDDAKLQAYAISTVIAISYASAEAREEFGAAGALQGVANALKQFATRLDIASYAALAGRNLCFNPENRDRFAAADGMSSLINAMHCVARRERDRGTGPHRDAVAHCVLAVISCTTDNAANKAAALDGLSVLTEASSLYVSDVRIAEHSAKLFRLLFADGLDWSAVRRRRGGTGPLGRLLGGMGIVGGDAAVRQLVDTCILILLKHRTHASVVENCSVFFRRCCEIGLADDIVVHDRYPDLQDVLQQAVEIHSGSDAVVREAISAYTRLRRASKKT